jgi:transcriptional regulator with XRE-family HTH domain
MNFKDALFSLMCELNLNQRQVCGMTGCSKASVSQYLSGKNVPSEQKQREIAESLGVDPDYFKEFTEPDKTKIIQKGTMKKLLPEVCAKILGVGKETIRLGLQQGVFPWGYAVQTSPGRWTYIINEQRFIDIEGIAP